MMKKCIFGVLMVVFLFMASVSFAGNGAEVVFNGTDTLTITKTKDNWKIEHTKCYLKVIENADPCKEECMDWDRENEAIPEGATHVRHTLYKGIIDPVKVLMNKTTVCTIEEDLETSECTECDFIKIDGPGGFGFNKKPVETPSPPEGSKNKKNK